MSTGQKSKVLLICAAALPLFTGCGDRLERQQAGLDRFVSGHQIGSSPDYWLELLNLYGEWERMALVSGYFDDYSGCTEIAMSLQDKFGRQYRCVPAN